MTTAFHRPRDAAEALALLEGTGRLPLGGGTQLNSSESRSLRYEAVALEGLLPRGIGRAGTALSIGASTTFQDILDSKEAPFALKEAARGMADRNIRNRATVGGNLGADKSCSSLVPALLALDARLTLLDGRSLRLEKWLELAPGRQGRSVIASVVLEPRKGLRAGYARWSRVACDIAILGAAAAFFDQDGIVRGLRLALGGVAAHARRFPALEAAFEGKVLPTREGIEGLVSGGDPSGHPYVSPIDDLRASAAFKRSRIASLVADAFANAYVGEANAYVGDAGSHDDEAQR